MREIKFRAWDGRQMVHDGDYWNGENRQNDVPSFAYPVSVTNKGIHWCKKLGPLKPGDIVRDEEGNQGYTSWEIDRVSGDVEVMHYTGLKDKNGVEIYEGDILRHASTGEITSVAWHGTMAGFIYKRPKDGKPHTSDYWWGELFRAYAHREVIGNIYENPELLATDGNKEES